MTQTEHTVESEENNRDQTEETEFGTRSNLLNALRGEGWVRATPIRDERSYERGFEIGEFEYRAYSREWEYVGSWTTGAGNGFKIYRDEIDGHTVDLAFTDQWRDATHCAYIAVFSDEGYRETSAASFDSGQSRFHDIVAELSIDN
jgi:hypothetical protein